MSSFKSHFYEPNPTPGFPPGEWELKADFSGCVCLDLAVDDYNSHRVDGRGRIFLSPFSDCSRIIGDDMQVWGLGGDDAMYSNGSDNWLMGEDGDDHITMAGQGGRIWGGRGEGDVCTDLGDNDLSSPFWPCEVCFGPEDVSLDCATGNPPPTAQPTRKPTTPPPSAQPTAPPTRKPATDQPTRAPNPPLPEILECFQRTNVTAGDHCETCCPACTPIVGTKDDMSSFTSYFELQEQENFGSHFVVDDDAGTWELNGEHGGGCICLDLAVDDYNSNGGGNGEIFLSQHSDCARIIGDDMQVWGEEGDDAMYSNGDRNYLYGLDGDDHLTMAGTGGSIEGGGGEDDVCTDLGVNQFVNEVFSSASRACESCLGPGGEELNCDDGEPIRRKLIHILA
jgi:hypothetical protein